MNISKFVGAKIKKYRNKKNITQQELGEYLGTTSQTISRYESGILEANQDVLFKLAEYFNISINDFFPPLSYNNTIPEYELNEEYQDEIDQLLFSKAKMLSDDEKQTIISVMDAIHKDIDKELDK